MKAIGKISPTSKRFMNSYTDVVQKNVFGKELKLCCDDPMTGFYRTGYCQTGNNDYGKHTVCSVITSEFLEYTASKGNDLSSVCDVGDKWCLCVSRWKQAYHDGKAPPVDLQATNIKSLEDVDLDTLSQFDVRNYSDPASNVKSDK